MRGIFDNEREADRMRGSIINTQLDTCGPLAINDRLQM